MIPEGQGAFSSRATVFGGNAVAGAARKLMANSRQVAAERFGVVEGEVEVRGGAVRWSDGGEEHETPFFELGDVEGEFRYEPPPGSVHRSGANLALVEVDPQTGGVSILKFAMCYDVGKAINPLAADGQLVGAIAQGISGTLLEEFTYSEDGQPLATSFVDYAMPTAVEVPWIDGVLLELGESPPDDPLAGAKGLGCGGIIGTAAAVANAVADALGARGNELTVLPITPELVQRLAGDS